MDRETWRFREKFRRFPRLQSCFMRVLVSTSTGRVFSSRVNRDLQREVVKRLSEQKGGVAHDTK